MPSTVYDSALFRDMFGTPEMRAVFSDEGYLQACLDTEAALARAQASVGMIPKEAAREITAKAQLECLDMGKLKTECENVGYPIVGLATQLAKVCAGEAGGYVHWGATTQDIMDTAVVLQVQRGLEIVEADLAACLALLGELAAKHRDVPMAGRTHLQHALPVTFGY
jgi:3-carboxy-cis,cis-muconate cycloisomerase